MAGTTTLETVTSAEGTEIAFERTGSGPPLVLVHGATADRTRWEPICPVFTEHFTVYAVDRRAAAKGRRCGLRRRAGGRGRRSGRRAYRATGDPARPLLRGDRRPGGGPAGRRLADPGPLRAAAAGERPGSRLGAGTRRDGIARRRRRARAGARLFLRHVVDVPPAEIEALRSAPNWPARVAAVHTVVREERARRAYEFDAARFTDLDAPTLLLLGGETAPFHEDGPEALPNSRIVVRRATPR